MSTNTIMKANWKKDKFIRISAENYEALGKLGTSKDTYNSVLTRILQNVKEDED